MFFVGGGVSTGADFVSKQANICRNLAAISLFICFCNGNQQTEMVVAGCPPKHLFSQGSIAFGAHRLYIAQLMCTILIRSRMNLIKENVYGVLNLIHDFNYSLTAKIVIYSLL